jgi:hypothetical protein
MLAPPDTEVGMGFLDKLLGRSKETAEDLGGSAKGAGDAATDTAPDPGETKDAFDRDEGTSEVTEAEQRLDSVRDETLRDEGRMP